MGEGNLFGEINRTEDILNGVLADQFKRLFLVLVKWCLFQSAILIFLKGVASSMGLARRADALLVKVLQISLFHPRGRLHLVFWVDDCLSKNKESGVRRKLQID